MNLSKRNPKRRRIKKGKSNLLCLKLASTEVLGSREDTSQEDRNKELLLPELFSENLKSYFLTKPPQLWTVSMNSVSNNVWMKLWRARQVSALLTDWTLSKTLRPFIFSIKVELQKLEATKNSWLKKDTSITWKKVSNSNDLNIFYHFFYFLSTISSNVEI